MFFNHYKLNNLLSYSSFQFLFRAPTLLLMIDKDMLNDQACSFQMISAHYLDPGNFC